MMMYKKVVNPMLENRSFPNKTQSKKVTIAVTLSDLIHQIINHDPYKFHPYQL